MFASGKIHSIYGCGKIQNCYYVLCDLFKSDVMYYFDNI